MVRLGVCVGLVALGSSICSAQWTVSLVDAPGFAGSRALGMSGENSIGYGINDDPITGHFFGHALIWNRDGTVNTDLHPTGYESTIGLGMSDTAQVGAGNILGGATHALLWHGSAASVVDLGPSDWDATDAVGVSSLGQVGYGFKEFASGYELHALYWNGSAASMIDLNPIGFWESRAFGIGDDFQVGVGMGDSGRRVLLWHGSAASAIDLTPSGAFGSFAGGGSGTHQVGWADFGSSSHAILWSGSAESAIDLNPAGFEGSGASAVNGSYQVGAAYTSGLSNTNHAMLWQGSAASAVDLHDYLGDLPFAINASDAIGVSENGDAIGYVYDTDWNQYFVRWTHVVPEPGSLLTLVLGLGLLSRRKKA